MPIRQLDRAAIRREARELIRTARVSPIKFTLLFLAVSLALSLLDTALYLTFFPKVILLWQQVRPSARKGGEENGI